MYSFNAINSFNMMSPWQYPVYGYNQFNAMPMTPQYIPYYNTPIFPSFNYNTNNAAVKAPQTSSYQQVQTKTSAINPITTKANPTPVVQEKKSNNEGMPTWAKWGLGILAVAGTCALAYFGFKGKNTIKSSGGTSVQGSTQLAKNINFKPAESVDDAIKFGKEQLNIKNYQGFEARDLDAINWVNEGLVNTANRMQGVVKMPKAIHYTDELADDVLAGIISGGNGEMAKYNGDLVINRKIIDNLDDSLSKQIKTMSDGSQIKVDANGSYRAPLSDLDEIRPLAEKIYKYNNGQMTTMKEKLSLYNECCHFSDEIGTFLTYPDRGIKQLLNNSDAKKILAGKNLETNLEVINTYSPEQKENLLHNMILELKKSDVDICLQHRTIDEFHTIYHEMGHLQDEVIRTRATGKFKNPSEYPQELKAWLNDTEAINTAARVSEYSTTGPGEFVAETYAGLISGTTYPNEVMALYKKLGGPIVP